MSASPVSPTLDELVASYKVADDARRRHSTLVYDCERQRLRRVLADLWREHLGDAMEVLVREERRDGPFMARGAEGAHGFARSLGEVRLHRVFGIWTMLLQEASGDVQEGEGWWCLSRGRVTALAGSAAVEDLDDELTGLDARERELGEAACAAARAVAEALVADLKRKLPQVHAIAFWAGWPSAALDAQGRTISRMTDPGLDWLTKGGPYWEPLAGVGGDERWQNLLAAHGLRMAPLP